MEPAREVLPDSVSIEGLEEVFEVLPTGADALATDAVSVAPTADSGEWVTVIEAASLLKKSERSIQRYAKNNKLRSMIDESGRLMIWLATDADKVATTADSAVTVATSADNERLWNLLKEKDAKIEALLMRNGYLQSQVETSQEAIKLLTDSQHKRGRWHSFWSWFTGR